MIKDINGRFDIFSISPVIRQHGAKVGPGPQDLGPWEPGPGTLLKV